MTGSYILGTAGGGLGPSVNNRKLHTGHSRGLTGAICYPGSAQWEVYSGLDHEHFTPRCEESGGGWPKVAQQGPYISGQVAYEGP